MDTPVTFTLDLENPQPAGAGVPRYASVMGRVLDHFAGLGIRGTVFVVGEVARENPALVRKISDFGHEIGFHSEHHLPLTRETPERFRSQCRAGKRRLEDLCGQPVVGFRAPCFSLTPGTTWALSVLADTGFGYSSSVLPARNPLHGFPGAPRRVFRWPNLLVEIPVPVARLGPFAIPYLGGFYLRYLPLWLVWRLARRSGAGRMPWTYCHPYDFDVGQPFSRMRDTSLIVSLLLWFNRARTLDKLTALLTSSAVRGRPLVEDLRAGRFDDAPIFPVSLSE